MPRGGRIIGRLHPAPRNLRGSRAGAHAGLGGRSLAAHDVLERRDRWILLLEPRRHVPYITDLEGEEARTLGPVLALMTRALKAATGSGVIYVYIFGGGIPHLHIHLAPRRRGDALHDRMIRGEVAETLLPSGATSIVSKEFPPLPTQAHANIRERVRHLLEGSRRAP
jgi:diadenosine tetraphosphate (Ap4A) HIT family hydrolase